MQRLGVGHVPGLSNLQIPSARASSYRPCNRLRVPNARQVQGCGIVAEECNRQQWEAALRKAKLRAKPWEVPTVMSEDLFW